MGYQDVTLYHLVFEGRDGLEVTAEGLSTGDLLDLMETAAKLGPDPAAAAKLNAEARPVIEGLMGTLAGALTEWNIEDRHGKPVPATLAGLKSLNLSLVMDIITAWMAAQNGVDDDLGKDSGSGGNSDLEQSIPMEPLSPNRSS